MKRILDEKKIEEAIRNFPKLNLETNNIRDLTLGIFLNRYGSEEKKKAR